MSILRRAYVVGKRNPRKVVASGLVVYGAIWLVLEPFLTLVPTVRGTSIGWLPFFGLVLVSATIGLLRVARLQEIPIKFLGNTVVVVFRKLWSYDGIKVIPVSRYMFETEVVPTSLLAQLIGRFADSEGPAGISLYRQKLKAALEGRQYEERERLPDRGKERYYELGTTANIKHRGHDYFLVAVTKTELRRHIPKDNCDITKLWIAIEKLWEEARSQALDKDINIPLIGSGITGINLSPNLILGLNLLAIVNSVVEEGQITTGKIRIVIHPEYFWEEVDLDNFRMWKNPSQ